jgi:tRNA G46 methylase TrmB
MQRNKPALGNFHTLTIEDFANMFKTSVDDIPAVCWDLVARSDFRYDVLKGVEKNEVISRVFRVLHTDSLKASGPHRRQDWETGWAENLEGYLKNSKDLNHLIPRFVRQKEVVRFRDEYIMPADASFETSFVKVLRYYLFLRYFSPFSRILEFGCGTGLNLVAASEMFPEKEFVGLDWSEASCTIVTELAHSLNINLRSRLFDMFSPDETLEMDPNCALFTVGAMEQLGENFRPLLDFILKKRPGICLNIEVIYELHDKNSLLGYMGAAYMEKRNYLRGLLPYLKELENSGNIEILEIARTIGSLYHDAYCYVVWKVKPQRQVEGCS